MRDVGDDGRISTRTVDGKRENNTITVRFFFSSRRRHTRFKCDWSSDVCSSDLQSRSAAGTMNSSRRGGAEKDLRLQLRLILIRCYDHPPMQQETLWWGIRAASLFQFHRGATRQACSACSKSVCQPAVCRLARLFFYDVRRGNIASNSSRACVSGSAFLLPARLDVPSCGHEKALGSRAGEGWALRAAWVRRTQTPAACAC